MSDLLRMFPAGCCVGLVVWIAVMMATYIVRNRLEE